MTNFLKKVLYRTLGQSAYLKVLHVLFFVSYDSGFLKKNYIYKYHYFVRHLINKGDYIVDIGSNLGYFSRIFARLTGAGGKVICIEPVPPFFRTLKWAIKSKNCVLHNKALGLENKRTTMSLPEVDGVFRTGLAHISSEATNDRFTFEVDMVKGSTLLSSLPRIDYIKCDIEGYEEFVLPELKEIIAAHRPIIQVETWGTQQAVVFKLMSDLGYVRYGVYKNKIIKDLPQGLESGDDIFIHSSAENNLMEKLAGIGVVWQGQLPGAA
jgi:FkbM family methyltransferase